jgi:hypothetical protein
MSEPTKALRRSMALILRLHTFGSQVIVLDRKVWNRQQGYFASTMAYDFFSNPVPPLYKHLGFRVLRENQ